ncbi:MULTISPECIES: NUDIX hydrolase [unclassified Arcicella]|uniref:NUDIX hydrolase n=1 Tax=unclassified Arcicella TaxID=2644986 RepID=UPI00286305A0|nr:MULTISPECIES: NUDIX hydrolase [unclassified Arcicella]MDR6561879.1 8-oxo-dGTP pyrophosphatase MutT (NUDIX family) [Arcicella sp. BE51]MDR6814025.1 8-oxo-dGTP pyrophosphatase MutT (NUDIX family) [Arcicella sp. BE140]MDR6825268.1 8-oxo-dGTP pyrophosphatase MutT (NUDIX family) [Arcicella sp. BE139]
MTTFDNPWKTISSREVYDNPWVNIRHEEVIKPNGEAGIYGVAHFKTRAAAILPLDEENNTWLVGQYRYTLNEYTWEIPMGGGSFEVDILESARRELKEETGIEAEKWTELGKLHTSNSVTDEVGFMFLAEGLTYGEAEPDDTEILVLKKVSLVEAIRMVMDSEITDSLSIATILKVARLKGI